MIKLTQEQAEEIRDMLHSLYHMTVEKYYPNKKLDQELKEIEDVISYLDNVDEEEN